MAPTLDLQDGDYGILVGRVSDAIQTSVPQQWRQMGARADALRVPIPADGKYADIQSRSKGLETRADLEDALTRAHGDPHCKVVIFFDDSRLIGDPEQAMILYKRLQRAHVRVFYENGAEENVQDRIGQLMMMIKGWTNEGEVIRLRTRVKNTLKDMADQGRMVSRLPFAVRSVPLFEAACQGACKGDPKICDARHGEVSKKGTVWIVDEEEQATLQLWYEWIASNKTWGSLEREMERLGCRKPVRELKRPKDPGRVGAEIGGGLWDKASMRRIMVNPFYRGVFSWGLREVDREDGPAVIKRLPDGQQVERNHALGPLVEPDLWWRAYDQIERRTKTREESRAYPQLLWDGFVFCGRCGWKMYPRLRVNGTRTVRYDYVCPSKLSKSSKRRCTEYHMIPELWLDWALGVELPAQGRKIPSVQVGFSTQTEKADSRAETAKVSALLSDLDDQEATVATERIRGKLSAARLDAELARIELERAELSERLRVLTAIPEDTTVTSSVPKELADLMQVLRDPRMSIDKARELLGKAVDRVIVNRPEVTIFLVE